MRDLRVLEAYRLRDCDYVGHDGGGQNGIFLLRSAVSGAKLRIIASDGLGWDHVSVSLAHRCPNWREMEQVKRLFFRDDETAMQLHVPPREHKSFHPYCLHLWRPQSGEIPRPPGALVGTPDDIATVKAIATGA